jgi:hypothetical protein
MDRSLERRKEGQSCSSRQHKQDVRDIAIRLVRFLSAGVSIDDLESGKMKTILIIIAVALLVIPAVSEYTQISGSYGKTWLAESGNKNVIEQQPSNQGLWSWGAIPKGRSLSNGKLMPAVPGTLIFPAFPSSDDPIVINGITPSKAMSGNNSTQLTDPYLSEDPWFIAQTSDRPVFYRDLPY